MRTILALLALASAAFAATPEEISIAMAMERERHRHQEIKVVIPQPDPEPKSANIFADYPAEKLRAALQPQAQQGAYASPPGYHRHIAIDGTVIEHSNDNNYKPVVTPAAHQNLTQSADGTWPQYSGPRAPDVRLPYATGYQPIRRMAYCPPGSP